MGLNDLKILFQKEKRVYLIFTIWLLIGYTVYQFLPQTQGTLIRAISLWVFLYLLNTCLLYMLCTFLLRQKVENNPMRIFLICFIIALPLPWIWIISAFLVSLWFTLFIIASLYWLLITSIFTMNECHNKAVEWDQKFEKWSKPLSKIIRLSIFIGGVIIATALLMILSEVLLSLKGHTNFSIEIIVFVGLFSIIVIWILFVFGIFATLFGKSSSWLGIYFIYIAYFAINIMISVVLLEIGTGSTLNLLPLQIAQYIFNLYLLFSAIAALVGEQSDLIAEKVKIIKTDTILMLLIFCMGMYQYGASDIMETTTISVISTIFPVLVLLFGIYAIITYKKKPKEEKAEIGKQEILTSVDAKPLYCAYCGVANKRDNKFCINCGKDLT